MATCGVFKMCVNIDNPKEFQVEKFTWEQFERGCQLLARQIKNSGFDFYGIYGIPRGGLVLAVRLSHLLKLKLFTKSPRLFNLRRVLIVDDISDTGKTLLSFKKEGFKIATLHYHLDTEVKPDFHVHIKHDKWIEYPWERSEA